MNLCIFLFWTILILPWTTAVPVTIIATSSQMQKNFPTRATLHAKHSRSPGADAVTLPDMSQFDQEYDSLKDVMQTVQASQAKFTLAFEAEREMVYNITATTVDLPNQPDLMVQMLLSVIVSHNNLTPEIDEAITDCLAQESQTEKIYWGMYKAKRFTPTLLQAEYFADVSEEASISFPLTVERVIQSGNLTRCVFDRDVGLGEKGALLAGRTTVAPRSGAIVSSTGGVPAWAVGAIIGGVALVVFVGLIIISVGDGGRYAEKDYVTDEDDNVLEGEDDGITGLEIIAGQRDGALLVQV